MTKVKIELTPYNALTILSFLREFVNEEVEGEYMFNALSESVDEFQEQITKNITNSQIDEAQQENKVNQLIGKSPTR